MAGDDEDARASEGTGGRPAPPDLPAYVLDPLERQSPERLAALARYARALASWKRDAAGGADPGESGRPAERAGTDAAGGDGQNADRPNAASDDPGAGPGRSVDADDLEALDERGVSTDPSSYEGVPDDGAYVTIKEPKPGYRYYYWQWRDGDSWKNQYIGPVDARD